MLGPGGLSTSIQRTYEGRPEELSVLQLPIDLFVMGVKGYFADAVRYRHAYGLAASAATGSVFYGWDVGLIGGILTMPSFKSYFGIDKMTASEQANLNGNIVAVLQGGCFFGALFTGYLSGRFGRKPTLLSSGVVYLIGSLIQSVVGIGTSATVALRLLYFSRWLGGVGVGMVSALVPSYVAECVPGEIRGRCTGTVQLANNIGIMLSFWVNYSAEKNLPHGNMQWRLPFIIQMVPGVFFMVFMISLPESPRYLVEIGKYERATRSLAFASGRSPDDKNVRITLEEIKADFEGKEKVPLLKQLTMMRESRTTALRCFIPSFIMFWQQATGTNGINYFSPTIFASLGVSGTTSGLLATGVYGVVKTVSVALALAFAVEALGRKKCLIIGGLGQAAMMLWIGAFSAIHPQPTVVPASYVSIAAVYLYAIFFCLGWEPLPWVVAAEVAPNHVRNAAYAVAIAVSWLFTFTVSKLTPIMLERITYGTFLLYGCGCILMSAWVYLFLPETRGHALEDIKYLFERDVVVRSLQDAPGGRLFLGSKRAIPVEELKAAEMDIGSHDDIKDVKVDDGDFKLDA
ncbi:unnamed protein product [Somion occarium]|uniref:Major facilitator superfamily (MFS) profile domain-containing protein n=2 Tax=Somion occarium TaxID=3059160 RepID=A0ABP1DL52_9APHY